MAHVTRALTPPASPAPAPVYVGACTSCGIPLVVGPGGVLWHRLTGALSCLPTLDTDGGWSEPDDWADGPCASTGAVRP